MKIGIGITTHNRPALVVNALKKIQEFTPSDDCKIVIVDDASDEVLPGLEVGVFRFQQNVGIARAKNKCLELLDDCEHIFLFDDDTWPIAPEWWRPYAESREPHLMYLFENWSNGSPVGDDRVIYRDGAIVAHTAARGCMLYVRRSVLDVVGGMDVRFGKAMNEHLDWSNRIYNAGLTMFTNMDVAESHRLIYSSDEHQAVASSVKRPERMELLKRNNQLLKESADSSMFAEYRERKNIVLACYFAGVNDPQRDQPWMVNLEEIEKLKNSVESFGVEFVLIHNCFDLPNRVEISESPYFARWFEEWKYLREHPEVGNVFLVDSTDVEMKRNPFPEMKQGLLYVGDETAAKLGCKWMITRHREVSVNSFLRENSPKTLFNCGVVGGGRKDVMAVCRDVFAYHFNRPGDETEMGIFNVLMHTKYLRQLEYGRHVTSEFKKYENSTRAYFRHK